MIQDYVIITPSYKRPEGMARIAAQLSEEAKTRRLKVTNIILDDGSPERQAYEDIKKSYGRGLYQVRLLRNPVNLGREGFWITWTSLLEALKEYHFKFAIALADDLILCKDFLCRATRNFEFLREQDGNCVCMNLMSLHPLNWGTARYEDGAFIATRKFFEVLTWKVREIPKDRFLGSRTRENRSSGVHHQITRRIAKTQWRIAASTGVSYCMVDCGADSVMFPKSRFNCRNDDLTWANNYIDGEPDGNGNGRDILRAGDGVQPGLDAHNLGIIGSPDAVLGIRFPGQN
jgi:hypothetical protein